MELNRDESLKNLRPVISSIVREDHSNLAEQFQNETLRPILKLQNELLIGAFHHYFIKRKGVFYGLSQAKKRAYIAQALQKDLPFRNFVTGLIAGHFSLSEWEQFRELGNEGRRRLITLLIQRVQDQLERLSSQPMY